MINISIMIDPIFAHWVTIAPIVLAVIVGILARRARYKDEVKECLKWVKENRTSGYNQESKRKEKHY